MAGSEGSHSAELFPGRRSSAHEETAEPEGSGNAKNVVSLEAVTSDEANDQDCDELPTPMRDKLLNNSSLRRVEATAEAAVDREI